MSFSPPNSFPRLRRLVLTAAFMQIAAASWANAEPDDASPWSPAPKSSVRILSSGPIAGGRYVGAVEIRLDANNITYWRNPGDAGVPPVFDFAGSKNLAAASVRFPAPKRIDEAGLEAFGYRDGVIFPVEIKPVYASRPIELALDLKFAVCDKICIPADAKARLIFAPAAKSGEQASRIAEAELLTPRGTETPGAPTFKLASRHGAKPEWKVQVSPPPSAPGADLFAEGAEGWYFETKRDGDGFALTLAQGPQGVSLSAAGLVLTYFDGAAGWEKRLSLDAAAQTP